MPLVSASPKSPMQDTTPGRIVDMESDAWQQKASNLRFRAGLGGVCAVGELAATGVAGGAVLRRSGWFDAGLIHSSAESLH